ncbi:TIGR04283 family arsenosugar biosynthesis glycosyltransferase [Thermodesulfobacteriota bacterium]
MKYQLSIIIPVLNEAYIINQTLRHLQNMDFDGTVEIIVVDGDPKGSTVNAITSADVKKAVASKGRGAQMNKGAVLAAGDILLFLHADVTLAMDAFKQIVDTCNRKNLAGGAFSFGINSKRKAFKIIEIAVAVRSHLTKIPYGDQAIFLKTKYFHQIGKFREIPLMEDVEMMRRIKQTGGRIVILPSKVLTSPRRWEKEGVVYCTLRNWLLITLYLFGASPERLVKFYR